MQIVFACPSCQAPQAQKVDADQSFIRCVSCGFSKPIGHRSAENESPAVCTLCGCNDLWRQKDFPQKLGLMMVVIAAILSTIAWAFYRPAIAIGILMAFAFIDLLLYTFMKDMLVCYRCGTRFRKTHIEDNHPSFDLELNERYRQEEIRLKD